MSIRYRWFKIGLSTDFNSFVNKLVSWPFIKGADFGFKLIENNIDEVSFQFIWQTTIIITQVNEEGVAEIQYVESLDFIDIVFLQRNDCTFMRVENPKQSMRNLMNSLESIVSMGFYQKPIIFDYQKPLSLFDKMEYIRLLNLKISGVTLKQDLLAKMEFTSTQGMQKNEIEFLDGLSYFVDSASYELMYRGIKGTIVFSKSGLVRISGELVPKILSILETQLPI